MILDTIKNKLKKYTNYTLYVGFSGGADSTCALYITNLYKEEFNYQVCAVHFNHNLRGQESDNEAIQAEKFCQKNNIPFKLVNLTFKDTTNLEAQARNARMSYWEKIAANKENTAVILGHHLDDNLENMFIRLGRGSGLSGLTSLREENTINNVLYIRLLLDVPRKEIENFLLSNNIDNWQNDSSNKEDFCIRNKLRNTILPLIYQEIPNFYSGITHSVAALKEDAIFIENYAKQLYEKNDIHDRNFWAQQPSAIIHRLLRLFLWEKLNIDESCDAKFLARFTNEIKIYHPEVRLIPWSKDITFVISKDFIDIKESTPDAVVWEWQKGKTSWGNFVFTAQISNKNFELPKLNEVIFALDKMPSKLLISKANEGDALIPFGKSNPVKIKKLRIDRKIASIPVLPVLRLENNTIIWAPNIRHSNFAVVEKEAHTQYVKITMRRK